jgi:hypothetical protein
MITTGDIEQYFYDKCSMFGLQVYKSDTSPSSAAAKEYIVIHVKRQTSEKFNVKCFVEINFVVPDTKTGLAQKKRLNALEKTAIDALRRGGEWIGNDFLSYQGEDKGIEADIDLKSHYVNIELLCEFKNLM